jgi:hypothetical protein
MATVAVSVESGHIPTEIVILGAAATLDALEPVVAVEPVLTVEAVLLFEQPDAAESTSMSETVIAIIRFFIIFLL